MKQVSTRISATLAALLVLVVAAAGCGGSTSGSTSSQGGILRVGTTGSIDSLNPFVAINPQAVNAFAMEYPQLVQYSRNLQLEGDWARSWSHSSDGLQWTFHLIPNTHWSDGKPMTAADVVWTAQTILKYAAGATAIRAGALEGVKSVTAPNPTTVVVTYKTPTGNALSQLAQFYVLPKHVWSHQTGGGGKDLKAYQVQDHLPTVAGGPYTITRYNAKGTTVFKPNASFYGPKSHAAAVALTWYTNPTSLVADMDEGNLDFIDQVPFGAATSLKGKAGVAVQLGENGELPSITFNSNPAKPKNRELLDPRVKEALEYATPRDQIAKVVFSGFARPYANLISSQSAPGGWVNPAVKPLPFDVAKANQMLDALGYTRGSDGVREVPATTGKYAQPTHQMAYGVIVPGAGTLDFNGDRQFQIIANAWAKAGVKLTEIPGGDASQAYAMETAGNYTKFDLATWYWIGYIDPNFMLSILTKGQWNGWSDTGYDNPAYDAEYRRQAGMVDQKARKALVWKMEQQIADARPYIQLVEERLITAHSTKWTDFAPDVNGYCKCYYTDPQQAG